MDTRALVSATLVAAVGVALWAPAGVRLLTEAPAPPAEGALAEAVGTTDRGTAITVRVEAPGDGASLRQGEQLLRGSVTIGGDSPDPRVALALTVDLSGSAFATTPAVCGDANADGLVNTVLDCQILAGIAAVDQAIAAGSVAQMGIIGFQRFSGPIDASPEPGIQGLVAPDADLDADGYPDLHEALRGMQRIILGSFAEFYGGTAFADINNPADLQARNVGQWRGGTNFEAGARGTCLMLAAAPQPLRKAIFLSDGKSSRGDVTLAVPCSPATPFVTIATPNRAGILNYGCDGASVREWGTLQVLADRSGGVCMEVADEGTLPQLLPRLITPELRALTVSVDGGPPISATPALALPYDGTGAVAFEAPVDLSPGPHTLCATATAFEDGAETVVQRCITVTADRPPLVDAGPDLDVDEGSLVALHATAEDVDGDAPDWSWEVVSGLATPGNQARHAFVALQDGEVVLRARASDGLEAGSDLVTVRVHNLPPALQLAVAPADANGATVLSARVADPGPLDQHELTVDWGDGSGPERVLASATATAAHRYGRAGSFVITVTAQDDGGAAVTEAITADVPVPLALWAGSAAAPTGLSWKAGSGAVTGRVYSQRPATVADGADWQAPDVIPGAVEAPPLDLDLSRYAPGGALALALGPVWRDRTDACVAGLWTPTEPLSGVIYVGCDALLDVALVNGPLTLVAEGRVRVEGDGGLLTPWSEGVVLAAGSAADDALELATTGTRVLGHLLAPWGTVDIEGEGNLVACAVVGDRVELSGCDQTLDGADCDAPGAVVRALPRLSAAAVPSQATAAPGEPVHIDVAVTHAGADVLLAGAIGVTNLDTSAATLTGLRLTVEVWDGAAWAPLDVPTEVRVAGGGWVPGAALPLDAAVLPGRTALWPVELHLGADPDQLQAWLAPDAPPVRVAGSVDVESPRALRALHRFGPDVLAPLRGADGALREVVVQLAGLDGEAHAWTLTPRLDVGQTAALRATSAAAAPTARRAPETVDAYLARLTALDGAPLAATGLVTARAPDGLGVSAVPLRAEAAFAAPALQLSTTGPTTVEPGDTARWTWSVANLTTAARDLSLVWTVTGDAATITGLPATLDGRRQATGQATWTTSDGGRYEVLPALRWSDAAGNAYGPVDAPAWLDVPDVLRVRTTLTAGLLVDADGNGAPGVGDTVRWTAIITPSRPAAELVLTVPAPGALVSTATTHGTVTTDNGVVTATLGSVATSATVTFDTTAPAVDRLTAQGSVTGWRVAPTLTDEPGLPGPADPTTLLLASGPPAPRATLLDTLVVDADLDGQAGVGDVLRYELWVDNDGLGALHDVVILAPLDEARVALVPGSAATSQGSTDGVTTLVGALGVMGRVYVTWEVVVHTVPFVGPFTTAQATIAGLEATLLSDDPTQPGATDPNLTPLRYVPAADTGVYPTVADLSPADGARVVRPTEVRADLAPTEGEDLVAWRVLLWPGDGDRADATVLAEGVGAPPDTTLATLDPTTLPNGLYNLSVEATDTAGLRGYADTSVWVAGAFKPGQRRIEVTDAEIASPAGPIALVRVYDTLERDTPGDFGWGWRLELRGFKVQTNGPLGAPGWGQQPCGAAWLFDLLCWTTARPHLTAVTWPDGRQEVFDLTPRQTSSVFPWAVTPGFTGRPGATSRLRALGSGFILWEPESTAMYAAGGIWDPDRFELTDTAGNTWRLRKGWGLERWTDVSGNTVDITEDGVFSSAGPDLLFDRDPEGRIEAARLPDGTVLAYGYTAAGELDNVVNQTLDITRYAYDPGHSLTTTSVDGVGVTGELSWDGGRVDDLRDGTGVGVSTSWDLDALTTTDTGPDPRLQTVTFYDEAGLPGRVEQRFDDEVYTTIQTYDEHYRIKTLTHPSGGTESFTYDDAGRVTAHRDPDGVLTQTVFGSSDLPLETWTAGQLTEARTLDPRGRTLETWRGARLTEAFTYADPLVATLLGLLQAPVDVTYSEDGSTVSWIDPDGVVASTTFDAMMRPTQRVIPELGGSEASYEPKGRLETWTDEAGGVASWTYDPGRAEMATYTDPLGHMESYTYDPAGRMETRVGRDGATITIGWDPQGRLASMASPSGISRSYTYDALGRMTHAEAEGISLDWTWDERGVSVETLSADGPHPLPPTSLAFTRAPSGKLREVDFNGTITRYHDDPTGQWIMVEDPAAGLVQLSRDEAGHPRAILLPGGIQTAITYDTAGRQVRRLTTRLGTAIHDLSYTYSPGGRPTSWTDDEGMHKLEYDDYGRLLTVDHAPSATLQDESYSYDRSGFRQSWRGTLAGQALYNVYGQLLQDGWGSYTYDLSGRRTTAAAWSVHTPDSWSYTWNAIGQLVQVDGTQGTWTFGYDAMDRRVRVTGPTGTRWFLYRDDLVYAVLDEGGAVLARHVTGLETGSIFAVVTPEDTPVTYAIRDRQDTPVAWITSTGETLRRVRRDAYGVRHDGPPVEVEPYGYTGYTEDPTGLLWAKSRYYSASTGLFLSADSLLDSERYLYARGSPTVYTDPTGHSPLVDINCSVRSGMNRAGDAYSVHHIVPKALEAAADLRNMVRGLCGPNFDFHNETINQMAIPDTCHYKEIHSGKSERYLTQMVVIVSMSATCSEAFDRMRLAVFRMAFPA